MNTRCRFTRGTHLLIVPARTFRSKELKDGSIAGPGGHHHRCRDGIGHSIARAFAREGARILVAELHADAGKAVAEELTAEFDADAHAVTTDVADEVAVRKIVAAAADRWGTVDILMNNAWGGGSLGRLDYKTNEQMAQGFESGSTARSGPCSRSSRQCAGPRQHQPLLAERRERPHRHQPARSRGRGSGSDDGAHLKRLRWGGRLPAVPKICVGGEVPGTVRAEASVRLEGVPPAPLTQPRLGDRSLPTAPVARSEAHTLRFRHLLPFALAPVHSESRIPPVA